MDFVNVLREKGVFADGVHDDTKALQACIDSVRDGGTVYFPDGVYLVSAALIFYSNQAFKLSDGAVIRRSEKSEPLTRYLLASYSEPEQSEYGGTHDVIISGGCFDGNEGLTEPSTLINTVHCKNIVIESCRFINCAYWHSIEINSTENAVVRGCVFNGQTYTRVSDVLHNEQIQLDRALEGSYGPVFNCDGRLIDFCADGTACRNILITDNIFKCDGFPAIGHHDDCGHSGITVSSNVFDGDSGRDNKSRGYIFFRKSVDNIKVINNCFVSPDNSDSPCVGIISESSDANALFAEGNIFQGSFDDTIVRGNHKYFKD